MAEEQIKNKKNIFIIAIIILIVFGISIYWQKRGTNKAEVSKEPGEENLTFPESLLPGAENMMTLGVYFGNEKFSVGTTTDCKKVFVLERKVPKTTSVARAALLELFKGLTEAEKNDGYFTAIGSGVEIKSLAIENGIAKADFNEVLKAGADNACKSSTIREQVVRTLKQFPTVKDAVISINGKEE